MLTIGDSMQQKLLFKPHAPVHLITHTCSDKGRERHKIILAHGGLCCVFYFQELLRLNLWCTFLTICSDLGWKTDVN